MGIDDIIAEQQGVRMRQAQQDAQNQQPRQSNQQRRRASIQLDLGGMDRDEAIFWMQVVQTIALVYIALKLS